MRRILQLAVLLLLLGACSRGEPAQEPPFRWVTRVLVPVPSPDEVGLTAASMLQDLVYLPVGYVVPDLGRCVPEAECRLAVPEGRRFHDGRRVDAAAVAERLEKALELTPEAVRAEGPELRIRLGAADLSAAAEVHLAARDARDGWVGSGPYRLLRNGPDRAELAAVDPERHPQRIVIERIPELRELLIALLSGEADFIDGVPAPNPRFLEATGVASFFADMERTGLYVVFDSRREALAEPEVRQCLVRLMEAAVAPYRPTLELEAPAQTVEAGDLVECARRVRASAPRLRLEVPVASESVTSVSEALLSGLQSLGLRIEPVPLGLDELDAPLTADMRVTPLSPATAAARNRDRDPLQRLGGDAVPGLHALLAAGGPEGVVSGRLASDPPAAFLGRLRLVMMASSRWRLDVPRFEAAGERWPLLFLVPAKAP